MQEKKIAIVGIGQSGFAAAKFFFKNNIHFSVCDTRLEPPNLADFQKLFPEIELRLGPLDASWLSQFDQLIVSPGLSIHEQALQQQLENGKEILGDVELFLHYAKAPICAITGSNGKSTVTTLVTEMAQQAKVNVKMGGNIGIPILELLCDTTEPDLYVLELSSFQLETTQSLKAKVATILNMSLDHMDRYQTFADYHAAKQRIFQNCETALFNRLDESTYPDLSTNQPKKMLSFGLDTPKSSTDFGVLVKDNQRYLTQGNTVLLNENELYLQGDHHVENALAALALGSICNLEMSAMLEALKNFKGLKHRCQLVYESEQLRWFNDSKGTNEGATLAAIKTLGNNVDGKVTLLAGGLSKGANFESLKQPTKDYVSNVILFGADKAKLSRALQDVTTVYEVDDMKEAVRLAKKISQAGDAVLLSPACASFDMFKNFEERGNVFIQAILELYQ